MISRQIIEAFDPDMVISIAHYPGKCRRKTTYLKQIAELLSENNTILWDQEAHKLYIRINDYVWGGPS